MSSKIKIVRNAYLYIAALISLLFVAIGAYTLLNTAIKTYVLPKAEKGGYGRCEYINREPMVCVDGKSDCNSSQNEEVSEEEQKIKREECYAEERQKNVADALTMIMIALPIFMFHWRLVRKEKDNEEAA